jgi:hypothetical protein
MRTHHTNRLPWLNLVSVAACALALAGCAAKEPESPAGGAGGASAGVGGGGGGRGGAAGKPADAGAGGLGGAAVPPAIQGTFALRLVAPEPQNDRPGYSQLEGSLYDGPQPSPLPLVVDKEEGACKLSKPLFPRCPGGCPGGECVDQGKCQLYPKPAAVGQVNVTGLGAPFTMKPEPPSDKYASMTLPYPPCTEGADVRIEGGGLTLAGKCVAPLALTSAGAIPVKKGQPVKLTWTPPGQPGATRVQIYLDIAHHGGKTGQIDCDVPDTGSFDIPAGLVGSLVDLGLAGFPTVIVTRVSKATAAQAPQVVLVATSSVEREVDTGVKSCNVDEDCGVGKVCDVNKRACP